ncbi:outer membrane protein assembly factor BamA [Marinobacterium sp. AK62]|uniref:Outer membrane protein assembly factor BamA n=1 Tax=Marinobacterium alkalitolerans TaxID=1542925 RepID=A0ABS3Z8U3_9GAMM|nr:outer membrane protein assembly factor BamA [Marinobacterium alkalitolerans]MBP0048123.1 outer membrane protein assembly factor BamA [Marinobacterium alkalitolerans]
MKRKLGLFFVSMLWMAQAQAAALPFEVNDIQLEGLQRVEPGIVFRHFPVNAGDSLTRDQLSDAVRELFGSGYFADIEVERTGDVLVLKLKERPSVALINIEGNDIIKEEQLLAGLKQSGLQEGDVFRRAALDQIRLDLLRVYTSQGRYGANITTDVEPLSGNRVQLNININEGQESTIQHINIVGNTVFTDEELKELFSLKLPNFWSFYTKDGQYAREKMTGDLERLRSWYFDHGYANFSIDSAQVSITPDKENIYITVSISEGEQFSVRDVSVAGEMVVPQDVLESAITLEPGQIFSREKMTRSQDKLVRLLGDEGYMFANVSPVPELHDDNTVSVKYFLEPGKRTYVRRISIKGNTRTADEVVRRELEQMEAGIASTRDIERSKTRLDKTGYFKTVNVETRPVPGTDDQVDLEYTVEEQQSGQFTASIGFSQNDGIIVDLGGQQDNFLGSGKKVGFNISNSSTRTEYSFNYLDPYYTVDGVSRGFDVYFRERDYEEDDISSYTADEAGGGVTFGYPIDDYQRLSFSGDIEFIKLNTFPQTAQEVRDYIDKEGNNFLNWKLTAGWSDNRLNRGFFPTRGYAQGASVEISIPGSDLAYMQANYRNKWYQPMNDDETWVVGLRGRLGYGDSFGDNAYPFFKHFYAGGLKNVRGFANNSLGPQDSNGDPFGGNLLMTGSAELIFPMPFVGDKSAWRSLVFMDAGNVYSTDCLSSQASCDNKVDLGDLRYSVGLGVSWLTPIGPLSISLGMPLNDKDDDDTEVFQFALGQTF